jgi:glycosyltransferase involved in cell wall biosynthesis
MMHLMGIYNRIDCWLAISKFMRDAFVGAGVPAEKVFVLRHSWNSRWTSAPVSRNQPEDGPSLLFLGRLTESKGVEVLLKAWELASVKVPNARLFIGGSGPMEKLVIAAAAKLPRCEYVGQVSGTRKEELLTNCTAMVVPSVWWEPLGLVTYEAYDYGKPVLAAAAGGLSETILPGETGWVHTPGDAQQLADQIVEALNHPEECQRRGTNGRNWLQQHTRTEDWLDEFDLIANEILSKPKFKSPPHQ